MTNPYFIGIEIGGTKLQIGLGRGDGQILALNVVRGPLEAPRESAPRLKRLSVPS